MKAVRRVGFGYVYCKLRVLSDWPLNPTYDYTIERELRKNEMSGSP